MTGSELFLLFLVFASMCGASYLVFDVALRQFLVEKFADKIRTVKRYYGYHVRYWAQGRVFGIWIDYRYSIHESQSQTDIEALKRSIENRKKPQEIIKEYDV